VGAQNEKRANEVPSEITTSISQKTVRHKIIEGAAGSSLDVGGLTNFEGLEA